jgi:chaperonin GroES
MIVVSVHDLQPLADRILAQPVERGELTRGGIYLPDTAREEPQMGKVLAVGPGRWLENGERQPLEVRTGDTILFAKYAGTELKVDGQDVLIINECDILAVVEG